MDPSSPTDSAPSAAAVIRRRSLATPGLATRKVSHVAQIENPDQSFPKSPLYQPEILDASPLSRLEDLKGVKRSPAIAGNGPGHPPRSETPGDLDYSHLGTYKLGSLMVTNGPPNSPKTAIVERRQPILVRANAESRTDDEYFTAQESESSDCDTIHATPRAINYSRPVSSVISNQISRTKRSSKVPPIDDGRGSPLKREVRQTSAKSIEPPSPFQADDEMEFPRYSTGSKPKPKSKSNTLAVLTRNQHHPNGALTTLMPFSDISNDSAEYLANEYQAELPESPFASDHPIEDFDVGPSRETSSPDQTFEDGISSVEKSPSNSENSIYSTVEKPRPRTAGGTEITRQTALGSHPPDFTDFPRRQTARLSKVPQSKSDSGYSSGASASVHESQRGEESVRSSLSTGNNASPQAPSYPPPAPPRMSIPRERDAYEHGAPLDEASSQLPSPQLSVHSSRDTSEPSPITADRRSKSWRKSMRLQLPRLLSSESSSSKSEKSVVSNSPSEKTVTESRTTKKLQKKRPFTYHAPISHAENDVVPRVPSAVQRRFGERPEQFNSPIGFPYEKTEPVKSPTPWDKVRPKSAHAKSSRPRPLSSHNVTMPNMHDLRISHPPVPTQQRRLSLSRLVRPKSSGRPVPRSSPSDEHLPEPHYSYEFASIGSVSNSLGSSPYAAADRARKSMSVPAQQFGPKMSIWNSRNELPMIPFKGPHGRREDNQSTFNSGYVGRRRPKSYHGRARRMEVLGEEDHEAEIGDEYLQRGRPELRPAKSFEAGGDFINGAVQPKAKANARPKSVGASIVRSRPYDNGSFVGQRPPIPHRTSWSEHERIWRERRDAAVRKTQGDEPLSRESSGNSTVTTWPEQEYFTQPHSPTRRGPQSPNLELPVISAQATPRSPRTRPQSEILSSKSQPNLRDRNAQTGWKAERGAQAEGFRGSYEGQAIRAQRISASPRIVPTVMKRGAKDKRYTYDMARGALIVDV